MIRVGVCIHCRPMYRLSLEDENRLGMADPYADVDGVGGGVWVNFHRRR